MSNNIYDFVEVKKAKAKFKKEKALISFMKKKASRKEKLFSFDQFLIMIAWLISFFMILYYELPVEYIIVSVVAFIVLNIAIGVWVNRFIFPIADKSYRKYLTMQTIFMIVWAPVLFMLMSMDRDDLISIWIIILIIFYFGVGVASGGKMFGKK